MSLKQLYSSSVSGQCIEPLQLSHCHFIPLCFLWQDGCSEAEAADLTERCELISDRLMTLEDELQTAILNQDQALTHILSKLRKCTYIIRTVCSIHVCVSTPVHPS